jgi:hypothetical protein
MTASGDMLTIATVALEHLDLGRRSRTFVAHRATDASTGEGSFDHKRSESCERGVLPQLSSYSTNDPISTGQRNRREFAQRGMAATAAKTLKPTDNENPTASKSPRGPRLPLSQSGVSEI